MSRKTFFIILLSIQLLPFSAFGKEEPGDLLDDLSLAELGSTFTDFKVIHKGSEVENNFNTEVYLSGTVFQKCWSKFEITNTTNDEEIRGAKLIGFRVRDLGGGRACQKELKDAKPRTKCVKDHPELNCVRLSQVDEARMNLASMGDGEIKIVRLDPNADTEIVRSESVPDIAAHVSKATVARLKKEKQEKARADEIKKAQHCVDNCAGDKAMESLNRLVELGVEVDFDAVSQKIAIRDLVSIEKQADKAKPEDLQALREQLISWNDEHPGNADRVADAYKKLAQKAIPPKGAKASDYELASQILGEAQQLEGLSSGKSTRFQNDQRDISVGRMQAIALDGVQNNMVFWPNYYNLMQQLQTETLAACQGQKASMEGCSASMQTLRSVSSIPQTATQIDQSRWQMQMQIQQQMQSAMNPMQSAQPVNGVQQPQQVQQPVNNGMPAANSSSMIPTNMGNTFFNSTPAQGMVWGGGQFGQPISMTPPSFAMGR